MALSPPFSPLLLTRVWMCSGCGVGGCGVVQIDRHGNVIKVTPPAHPFTPPQHEGRKGGRLAYVLYTSGSTVRKHGYMGHTAETERESRTKKGGEGRAGKAVETYLYIYMSQAHRGACLTRLVSVCLCLCL